MGGRIKGVWKGSRKEGDGKGREGREEVRVKEEERKATETQEDKR